MSLSKFHILSRIEILPTGLTHEILASVRQPAIQSQNLSLPSLRGNDEAAKASPGREFPSSSRALLQVARTCNWGKYIIPLGSHKSIYTSLNLLVLVWLCNGEVSTIWLEIYRQHLPELKTSMSQSNHFLNSSAFEFHLFTNDWEGLLQNWSYVILQHPTLKKKKKSAIQINLALTCTSCRLHLNFWSTPGRSTRHLLLLWAAQQMQVIKDLLKNEFQSPKVFSGHSNLIQNMFVQR